jgi:hypothetical protein
MIDIAELQRLVLTSDIDVTIAYASPILYMVYVEVAKRILPVETKSSKPVFDILKLVHNLGLAIASLALLVGIIYCGLESGKFNSVHSALCGPFQDEYTASMVGRYFYLSKYWEWIDTAFLITGGKEISWLQYTHHMSTAILVYANTSPVISSASLLACFTNTFVHVFMYFYYAFPHGFMKKYRKFITTIQIIQHCLCLSGFTYIYFNLDSCVTTTVGIKMALMLYVMYLTFFVLFYIVAYVQNGDGKKAKSKVKKVE